jgi:O-antigen/teichoic acid export membrane protein
MFRGSTAAAPAGGAPEMIRRLVRGSALQLSAHLFLMLCTYLVSVVLARALGPVAFGAYGVIYSILMAVELVARFGIPQATGKLMAERAAEADDDGTAATGLTLSLLALGGVFGAMWLLAPVLAELFRIPDGTFLLRLAFWDIPVYGVFFALWHILNARRRFVVESAAFFLYAATKAVGVGVLVALGPTLAGALAINIAASAAAALFIAWFVGRAPWRFSLGQAGPVLRLAAPIAVLILGIQLLPNLDLWVLSAAGGHVDDAVRGYYVAALSVARIPGFVAHAMNAVLVTSIASAMGAGDRPAVRRALQGATRFLMVALLPAGALLAVNAREILTLLYSADYAPAAPLLAVLAFAQGSFITTFTTLVSIMTGGGQAVAASRLALGALPFAVALNYALALLFGAMGAAIGSLVACAAVVAGAALLLRREHGPLLGPGTLARVVLATAAAAAVSAAVEAEGAWLAVELVLVGLAYLAALPLLGLVNRADIELLRPSGGRVAGGQPHG